MIRPCSKCGIAHRRNHAYCSECHAAYMREHRKGRPLSDEARRKDSARSYAGVYLRRGLIERGPCVDCGDEDAQMHHEDYSKPLDIIWLCRSCHLELHRPQ